MAVSSHSSALPPQRSATSGLFRTAVAGRSEPLSQVFRALREGRWDSHQALPSRPEISRALVPVADGAGAWEMLNFNDKAYVVISDCEFAQARSEQVLPDGLVEFHYTLDGRAQAERIPVAGMDLVVCCPGAQASYTVRCHQGPRRSVALYIKREMLDDYLDPRRAPGSSILRELDDVQDEHLFLRRVPLDLKRALIVRQLIANPYADARRLLYAEAKVTELLCTSLDLWPTGPASERIATSMTSRDLRGLEQVRALIAQDLSRAWTIPELAREIGMNATKLKAGFRSTFGCTVFNYTTQARMERALDLLQCGEHSVTQVACAVGYRHASSFSSAFQQYFGHSPRRALAH